jgi:hypothetical protein
MSSLTIVLLVLVFAYILFYLRASVYKREGFYYGDTDSAPPVKTKRVRSSKK